MKSYILIATLFVFGATFAQEGKSYTQSSGWFTGIATIPLNEKFSIDAEVQLSKTNFIDDWQQIILRPALHYKLNKEVDFAVGYSYVRNYAYSDYSTPIDANENNVWEQVTLSHSSGKVKFSHRFRFEQRFVDDVVITANGYETEGNIFVNRVRYRFTTTVPLFKISENMPISGEFFDEIWVNEKTEGVVPTSLNQNWFYVGIGLPLTKKMTMSVGYLNDYTELKGNSHESNNILYTTIKYKF